MDRTNMNEQKKKKLYFSILKDQDLFRLINFFPIYMYYIINVLIEQGGNNKKIQEKIITTINL